MEGKRSQGGWREVGRGRETVVGRWIDGIFFTEGERRGNRPYPFGKGAFTMLLFSGMKQTFQAQGLLNT